MAFGRTHGVSSTGVRWYYGGDCVGNIRHGFGVCFWENGDRYEGSWADDKTDGCGVYVQGDGARYDGQFFQHKMHGFGICTYADGDRCEGQWRAGEFYQPCAVPAEIIDFARHSANQARQASQGMVSMPSTTSGISSFPLQVWAIFFVCRDILRSQIVFMIESPLTKDSISNAVVVCRQVFLLLAFESISKCI